MLPFALVSVFVARQKFGLGEGPVGFGSNQASGVAQVGFASPWLSPVHCVFGKGERLQALSLGF